MPWAPSPPAPKPTLTPSLTTAALVVIAFAQKWRAEAFRGGSKGRTGQGRAGGWGAGRGMSPNPPPFPSPSSTARLVILNTSQSLNKLKPAAAPGWGGIGVGAVHLSPVLAERSCRGVTLRLGGSQPPPQHPPPRARGLAHTCREASPTPVLSAQGNTDRLLGHAVAAPSHRAALPGQTLPPSAPRLFCEARHGAGRASKPRLLPSGLHLPPGNN